jgi:phosphoglycerate dehydrogenase-like enzyme
MNRPAVLITESIAPAPLRWLEQHAEVLTGQPSPDLLAQIQALIVRTYTRVDSELLELAPALRVVARAGVGLDNIDLDACRARSIPVVYTPDANTHAVAEYVISMMIQALRPIDRLRAPLDDRRWQQVRAEAVTPRSCVGARLGIIGFGRIGSSVARTAAAMGMQVRYTDLREIDPADRHGAAPCDLAEIARDSDVVSVHVDARTGNQHLLDASFFRSLRSDAVLINTARGSVLDTNAAAAFAATHPEARLVLDVFDPEPIEPDSPLWGLDNAVLTPHIAAGTAGAKEAMSWVVRDVVRVLNNQAPTHPAH